MAKNTCIEALREPIYLILLLTSLIFISLFPFFSLFAFNEQIKLIIDSSMATTLLFSLIVAVLCASHTITREMENGTVLLLLSKPVHKWSFILAKIVGISASVSIFTLLCNSATLTTMYILKRAYHQNYPIFLGFIFLLLVSLIYGGVRNYLHNESPISNSIVALLILLPTYALIIHLTGNEIENLTFRNVFAAFGLITFASLIMGAITVCFATRFNLIVNLMLSFIIFVLGLMSNYLFGSYIETNFFYSAIFAILPNWQYFWMADAISNNQIIPIGYVINAFIYTILYILFLASLAIILFQNKEVAEGTK